MEQKIIKIAYHNGGWAWHSKSGVTEIGKRDVRMTLLSVPLRTALTFRTTGTFCDYELNSFFKRKN